ncbi:MAG TPA: MerR family transcriptional regulator [Candidatus Dormibacteraeota bacterium]|nr:MerR family transcriptional regulator [Candidatus Dormibacteraeota bacterium]
MASENPNPRETVQFDLDKPIYTLGVASEMLDAHPRTLMVYEQLEMIRPRRTATNRRRYSPRDVLKLQAIQKLTRRHGVNLAGARFILELLKELNDHAVEPPARFRDVDVSLLQL